MKLRFTKMQSLGNDFIMLNGISEKIHINRQVAKAISDRRFGIGCDQILLAESPPHGKNGFTMRIFNSDGSEVGQCGNGARCFARFLQSEDLAKDNRIEVNTITTTLQLVLNQDNTVTVEMGRPQFAPENIPLDETTEQITYSARTESGNHEFSAVSIGNPHCVLMVDDVNSAGVDEIGPQLECHPKFPEKANIGFCQIIDRSHIRLRVYERGAGETLGCGSGACAAVVIGIRRGLLDEKVSVSLPGGDVSVSWNGDSSQVLLNGPVSSVFKGEMVLADGVFGANESSESHQR